MIGAALMIAGAVFAGVWYLALIAALLGFRMRSPFRYISHPNGNGGQT